MIREDIRSFDSQSQSSQQPHPVQIESTQYTVVLFGQTGSGKSSILNSLQNEKYFKQSEMLESETRNVEYVVSTFKGGKDQDKVLFVDTPGFGDTNADNERDNHLKIVDFLKVIKDGFSYVFFVIPLMETRFSQTLQQSLKLLGIMFGKDVYDNIRVIYSQGNQMLPKFKNQRLETFRSSFVPMCKDIEIELNETESFQYDYEDKELGGLEGLRDLVLSSKEKWNCNLLGVVRENIHLDFKNPFILLKKIYQKDQGFQKSLLEIEKYKQELQKLEDQKKGIEYQLEQQEKKVHKLQQQFDVKAKAYEEQVGDLKVMLENEQRQKEALKKKMNQTVLQAKKEQQKPPQKKKKLEWCRIL